jgi:D-arabinose 1-dehydrogenase-like Zn-dependent alcohol dehydrogenase
MRELVDLAAAGKVHSHVSRTGALSDLGAIFDELEGGRYLGRAVLTDLAR